MNKTLNQEQFGKNAAGYLTSTPHALQLLRLAIAMGRFYGLPVYSNALTDARAPDPQAACESLRFRVPERDDHICILT